MRISNTAPDSKDTMESLMINDDRHEAPPNEITEMLLLASEQTTKYTSPGENLLQNVESATPEDRAFAHKAAESSKLLNDWCDEIDSWPWNGDFNNPEDELGLPPSSTNTERCGSLSRSQVAHYQQRLDTIQQHLEELDIEGQKRHVLKNHYRSKSLSSSSWFLDGNDHASSLVNGLKATVTATVMQCLPNHSYLLTMIETWSARLSVLCQVPDVLAEIDSTQKAIDAAWLAIGIRQDRSSGLRRARTIKVGAKGMFRESYERIRHDIESKVAILGRRIDSMLDAIEGQQDTLPDDWIEAVEGFEIEYSSWTVEAHKKVMQYELRLDVGQAHNNLRNIDVSSTETTRSRSSDPGKRVSVHVPGAWSDNDSDSIEELQAPYSDPNFEFPAPAQLVRRPTVTFRGLPEPKSQPHPPAEESERPSSRESARTTQTNIIREHIRRHTSYPGLFHVARPQSNQSSTSIARPASGKLDAKIDVPLHEEVAQRAPATTEDATFEDQHDLASFKDMLSSMPIPVSSDPEPPQILTDPICQPKFQDAGSLRQLNGNVSSSPTWSGSGGLEQQRHETITASDNWQRPPVPTRSTYGQHQYSSLQEEQIPRPGISNSNPIGGGYVGVPRAQLQASTRDMLRVHEGISKDVTVKTDRATSPRPPKIPQRHPRRGRKAIASPCRSLSSGKAEDGIVNQIIKHSDGSGPNIQRSENTGDYDARRRPSSSQTSSNEDSSILGSMLLGTPDTSLSQGFLDVPQIRPRTPSRSPSRLPLSEQLEKHLEGILTTTVEEVRLGKGVGSEEVRQGAIDNRKIYVLEPSLKQELQQSSTIREDHITLYELHGPEFYTPIKCYLKLAGRGGHQVMLRTKGGWVDFGRFLRRLTDPTSRNRDMKQEEAYVNPRSLSTASSTSKSTFIGDLPEFPQSDGGDLFKKRTKSYGRGVKGEAGAQTLPVEKLSPRQSRLIDTGTQTGQPSSPTQLAAKQCPRSPPPAPHTLPVKPIRSLSSRKRHSSVQVPSADAASYASPNFLQSPTSDDHVRSISLGSPSSLHSPRSISNIQDHASSSSIGSRLSLHSPSLRAHRKQISSVSIQSQSSPWASRAHNTSTRPVSANNNKRDSWTVGNDLIGNRSSLTEEQLKWMNEMAARAKEQWGKHAPDLDDMKSQEDGAMGLGIVKVAE